MILQIADGVSDDAVARVRALLDETELRNVNFSGVEFEIERGDFTCFPDDVSDEYETTALLHRIFEEIENRSDPRTEFPEED